MSDSDDRLKMAVKVFLESIGLCVVDIPRENRKTPDLLVEEGTADATLIELKQKTHDPVELETYLKTTDSVGIASRSRPTGRRNRLDGVLASGVEQLVAKDPE